MSNRSTQQNTIQAFVSIAKQLDHCNESKHDIELVSGVTTVLEHISMDLLRTNNNTTSTGGRYKISKKHHGKETRKNTSSIVTTVVKDPLFIIKMALLCKSLNMVYMQCSLDALSIFFTKTHQNEEEDRLQCEVTNNQEGKTERYKECNYHDRQKSLRSLLEVVHVSRLLLLSIEREKVVRRNQRRQQHQRKRPPFIQRTATTNTRKNNSSISSSRSTIHSILKDVIEVLDRISSVTNLSIIQKPLIDAMTSIMRIHSTTSTRTKTSACSNSIKQLQLLLPKMIQCHCVSIATNMMAVAKEGIATRSERGSQYNTSLDLSWVVNTVIIAELQKNGYSPSSSHYGDETSQERRYSYNCKELWKVVHSIVTHVYNAIRDVTDDDTTSRTKVRSSSSRSRSNSNTTFLWHDEWEQKCNLQLEEMLQESAIEVSGGGGKSDDNSSTLTKLTSNLSSNSSTTSTSNSSDSMNSSKMDIENTCSEVQQETQILKEKRRQVITTISYEVQEKPLLYLCEQLLKDDPKNHNHNSTTTTNPGFLLLFAFLALKATNISEHCRRNIIIVLCKSLNTAATLTSMKQKKMTGLLSSSQQDLHIITDALFLFTPNYTIVRKTLIQILTLVSGNQLDITRKNLLHIIPFFLRRDKSMEEMKDVHMILRKLCHKKPKSSKVLCIHGKRIVKSIINRIIRTTTTTTTTTTAKNQGTNNGDDGVEYEECIKTISLLICNLNLNDEQNREFLLESSSILAPLATFAVGYNSAENDDDDDDDDAKGLWKENIKKAMLKISNILILESRYI